MKEHVRYLCNEQRNGGPCGTGGQSWATWDGRLKLGHVGREVKVGPCGMGGQSWAMWDGRSKLGHVGREVKVGPRGTGGQS